MRNLAPGIVALLVGVVAVATTAAAQAQELTPEETIAVQRAMAGTWAWGADRSLEDQRTIQEETLPALQQSLDHQKAVLDALEAQLAAAEEEQNEVQSQAVQAAPAGGFPAWLGAAFAAVVGAAVGAAGMRFYGQRKPPEKPA